MRLYVKKRGILVKTNFRKEPWLCTIDEICRYLKTNQNIGLTNIESQKRLEQFGLNQLPKTKKFSILALFLSQFSSLIVWILIGALIISGILGEWQDALAIGVIVLLNAIIGFVQEYHTEKSIEALRKLINPTSRVVREGIEQIISSQLIVPGDLVMLEAGDHVPADGRIVRALSFATQEASLTGESISIVKTVDQLTQEKLMLGDRKNMVFMGTSVVNGKGVMLVTETALNTQLGHIASLLKTIEEERTPLQIQLTKVGNNLIVICLGIVTIIFLIGLVRGNEIFPMVLTALSLAVAAIPEGLPAIMTITLSLGVKRMAKRNALIRRLSSVETLGCTTVICTDKTGTLTKNEMVVKSVWVNNSFIDITGIGYKPIGDFMLNKMIINFQQNHELMLTLSIGMLCNAASLVQKNDGWSVIGDPTEGALLTAAGKAGLQRKVLIAENKLITEIPFDSERKRMSMLMQTSEGHVLYVKGAPDILVHHAASILVNGKETTLETEQKDNILRANEALAQQALRVLGVAYRKMQDVNQVDESIENQLVFVGLIAMIDPPRVEAQEAIQLCKKAGIRTIMITGDQKETAIAIAKELDLLGNDHRALSGFELDEMDDDTLKKNVLSTNVYARVSAQHKLRIVKMLKSLNHVVAVTGDGVNDAPAIKAADIGIAMGITGTEVSKEASDMVIMDDNFVSIVHAVEEGRGIYDNLVKFINYLVSSNIAELIIIFIGTLVGFTDSEGVHYILLLPIHLLWLNLVTDGFPAIALGVDPVDPQVMHRPPRKKTEPIFSALFMLELFAIGCIIALGALVAFYLGLAISAVHGRTMGLTSLVVLSFVRVYLVRTQYHLSFFSNYWLIAALTGSFLLHLFVVYIPWLQTIFKTTALMPQDWLFIGGVTIIVWLVGSVTAKFFEKLRTNKMILMQ